MNDLIRIRDLTLRCIIGIYPEERTQKQDVILQITLRTDMRKAARTDRIEDAMDYKALKKDIVKLVEGSSFQLIETMADRVATLCLQDRRVTEATVCVDKPAALRFARSVAVELTRRSPRPRRTPRGKSLSQ